MNRRKSLARRVEKVAPEAATVASGPEALASNANLAQTLLDLEGLFQQFFGNPDPLLTDEDRALCNQVIAEAGQ